MGRLLSKIIFCFGFFVSGFVLAQTGTDADNVQRPKDYKDQEQFKHFYKRREAVAKWQINQLKNGALLVRLKTNQMAIDALKKAGNSDYATAIENKTWIENKIIVRAYTSFYKFSKVYFFYSNYSDTVLKGATHGVFLDTNLTIDPTIEKKEMYYLIAEEDFEYSTSIGYVKEDTAKFMKQEGTKSVLCHIIVKNKYGHQLSDPFPYKIYYAIGSTSATVKIYEKNISGHLISGNINKSNTFKAYTNHVKNFNRILNRFYVEAKGYEVTDPDIKPFLY